MIVARIVGAAAVAALCWHAAPARAQAARGPYFGRTTRGAAAAPAPDRRGLGVKRTAAAARPSADPLAPYTSRPRPAASGTPIAPPPERPRPRPVARNYFPTARGGQVRHHCAPSRASVLGTGTRR